MPDHHWESLLASATQEVEETVLALPEVLREKAKALPVIFEKRPSRGLRKDGIEPDTLGLFVGPGYPDEGLTTTPLPPQIVLFLENIWEMAEGDEQAYVEEVHITFMHELGHYLGLEEDGLAERGLD
jgi:predicted Zn-dependent protease with MMP-like domain